ncbi:MAG: YdcF family protein [Aquamicrobium sp.]|uniref:YdcF family protein n=1 Tax=Aquamicrobium sp. TaxID=1872579 RepID=UPI00349EFC95|nr:YdcF family protein [Aquamicrobium sp.]MCO5158750.1 YdcF family protein [Aquamicrobium sp.]
MKGPESTRENAEGRARPRGRRAAGIVFAILFGGALAFLGGFAAFASHVARLTTPAEQPDADAIIVLTGGEKRLDAAVDLLKSGKGRRLLISGVHPAAGLSDLQRATGGDAGLFSCCVDIDHAALDTIGNAEESAKWVTSHAYDRVIVVTNNYHMPRSLLELKRLIGDTELQPYPVVNTRLDGGEWVANREALRVLFTEYAKYLGALARGVVPGLSPRAAGQDEAQHAGTAG